MALSDAGTPSDGASTGSRLVSILPGGRPMDNCGVCGTSWTTQSRDTDTEVV